MKAQESVWAAVHYYTKAAQIKWHHSSRMSIQLNMQLAASGDGARGTTSHKSTVALFSCCESIKTLYLFFHLSVSTARAYWRFGISHNIHLAFIFLRFEYLAMAFSSYSSCFITIFFLKPSNILTSAMFPNDKSFNPPPSELLQQNKTPKKCH